MKRANIRYSLIAVGALSVATFGQGLVEGSDQDQLSDPSLKPTPIELQGREHKRLQDNAYEDQLVIDDIVAKQRQIQYRQEAEEFIKNSQPVIGGNTLDTHVENLLDVPHINGLKPFQCALYVKKAGDKLGFDYNLEDVWNWEYSNRSVAEIEDPEQLYDLNIKPGMTITFYHPRSNYKNRLDKEGKKVNSTHIALVRGYKDGKIIIAHQDGSKQKTQESVRDLMGRNWTPVEVFNPLN